MVKLKLILAATATAAPVLKAFFTSPAPPCTPSCTLQPALHRTLQPINLLHSVIHIRAWSKSLVCQSCARRQRCRRWRPFSPSARYATNTVSEATDRAEDGVSLRPLMDLNSDASYLESEVTQWLDEEWIPQEIHRNISHVAACSYVAARKKGLIDLGEILVSVGSNLEDTNMGDSFVDAWTVANKVSDLLLARLGREVCCPEHELTENQVALVTEAKTIQELQPEREAKSEDMGHANSDDTVQLLNPEPPPDWFTMDRLSRAADWYRDEFRRYDFIRKFLDGVEGMWEEANVIMAILLGFRYDEFGNVDKRRVDARFKDLTYPPDFKANWSLRDKLEALLREDEDEDKIKSLEELLEVMVGKAYYHQTNKGADEDFECRATLIKWIYEHDFVNDFDALLSVRAILETKGRVEEKLDDRPPNRYLY